MESWKFWLMFTAWLISFCTSLSMARALRRMRPNRRAVEAEFREFVGGPFDGQVRLCETKKIQIPRFVQSYEYVLDPEGRMVLADD